jgi:hypothetical protein
MVDGWKGDVIAQAEIESDKSFVVAAAKYIVGIDLGTTNMVLSYSRIISGSDNEADDGEAINYLLIARTA